MEKRLKQIFGSRYGTLTYGEVNAAMEVLRWCDGSLPEGKSSTHQLARYIARAVVVATGIRWVVVKSKSRRRDVVNARIISFGLMHKFSDIPKSAIASALDIPRDHATVLCALNSIEELLLFDRDFKYNYENALKLVKQYLEEGETNADSEEA